MHCLRRANTDTCLWLSAKLAESSLAVSSLINCRTGHRSSLNAGARCQHCLFLMRPSFCTSLLNFKLLLDTLIITQYRQNASSELQKVRINYVDERGRILPTTVRRQVIKQPIKYVDGAGSLEQLLYGCQAHTPPSKPGRYKAKRKTPRGVLFLFNFA